MSAAVDDMMGPMSMDALAEDLERERSLAETAYKEAHDWLQRKRDKLIERMAFYRGFHHGRPRFGLFEQDLLPDDRVAFEVFNYIRPTVRTAAEKRLRAWPSPSVVPRSSDVASLIKARTTQRLARSLFQSNVISYEEVYHATLAAEIHGAGWLKVYWDPNLGSGVPAPGNICTEYCSILDVFPDPTARRVSDCRYIYHRKIMPAGMAEDEYPTDVFGADTKGKFSTLGNQLVDGFTLTDDSENIARQFATEESQLVEIIERWERPSNRYPAGRLIVFSGPTIIAFGMDSQGMPSLPYEFPWVCLSGTNKIPGSIYADGIVEDAISPQRSINEGVSRMKETMKTMAAPNWLIPVQGEIPVENFDDVGGQFIPYLYPYEPKQAVSQGINPTVFDYLQANKQAVSDITAQSDVARGQTPPPGTSARSIAFQAELNDSINAVDNAIWKLACRDIILICLSHIRDFWQEGRVLKVLGPNNQLEAQVFLSEDFDFDAEIVVDVTSQEPTSRAVRISEAMEMLSAGAYEDTPGAQRFRKNLSLDADDTSMQQIYQRHYERAQQMQMAYLRQGLVPQLLPYESQHDPYLDADELFLISSEFLASDPMLQQGYIQYYMQRSQIRAQQFAQFSSQGAQPEPPGHKPGKKGRESPADGGHSTPTDQVTNEQSVYSS